jgi:hypothetical protein
MAKQTISAAPIQTTDAEFQAWVTAISNGFQALFTKVTQTGEINIATVSKPTAVNTSQGFEVYRFNDSLQATAPLYFKVEYGSASLAVNPSLWLTVGKGADGSGTITSVLLARQQVFYPYSNSASFYNSYIGSGDGSCLIFSLFPSAPGVGGQGSYCVVERSRDGSGNPTAAGVFWQYSGQSNSYDYCETSDYTPIQKITLQSGCINIPANLDTNISLSNGVSSPVFTGFVMTPSRVSWVPTAIVGAAQSDFGVGVVAASVVGAIDYLAMGLASQYSDVAKQQYSAVLLRWD